MSDLVLEVPWRHDGLVHFVAVPGIFGGVGQVRCNHGLLTAALLTAAVRSVGAIDPSTPVDCVACLSAPALSVEDAYREHLLWCDACNYDKRCLGCEGGYPDSQHGCNCKGLGAKLKRAAYGGR